MMGALWMLLSALLFGCMGVLVKIGAAHFSSGELVFYRSLFSFLFIGAMMARGGAGLATPHWRGHVWRGLSGTVAMMLFFYCISVLPLATAITLNYTSSLFLAALTVIVAREKLHLPLGAVLALGFLGVVLLLHPTLAQAQLGVGLLGLLSGLLAGVAIFNVRQMGQQGESARRIVFYFNLMAVAGSGGWMMGVWTIGTGLLGAHGGAPHLPALSDLPLLVAIGASATLAQLAMTHAYRVGHTLAISSLSYSTIAFASLFDWLFWQRALPLSAWLGMLLIIASGVVSLRLSPALEKMRRATYNK
jgi:drug/metabolite transporter (DMT)-like permease